MKGPIHHLLVNQACVLNYWLQDFQVLHLKYKELIFFVFSFETCKLLLLLVFFLNYLHLS